MEGVRVAAEADDEGAELGFKAEETAACSCGVIAVDK